MAFFIDENSISLKQLQGIIQSSQLEPSYSILQQQLPSLITNFTNWGFESLADLRKALGTPQKLLMLAKTIQLDQKLLIILRREVEAWFPGPIPLREWVWFEEEDLERLQKISIGNHIQLYEALEDNDRDPDIKDMVHPTIDWPLILGTLNLTRVRWVSPLLADMLMKTNFQSVEAIAQAQATQLHECLVQINHGGEFYRGDIGIRDIARLIHAAQTLKEYG